MQTLIIVTIILLIVLITINISAIWLAKKGYTRDDNNNMIPDIIEEKFVELKKDVSITVDRVGQELKDVGKALSQVGNQLGDLPKAVQGKTRPGRKPKK
tara:strand:+ start:178 stop:474 length:297 start_codon:yes stop_codon:yes gene_type:complete